MIKKYIISNKWVEQIKLRDHYKIYLQDQSVVNISHMFQIVIFETFIVAVHALKLNESDDR